MELRHLRYFLAVAEELHFSRAAERLNMAQPPLSQQVRALEDELGVRLFDRSHRRVQLTEAGKTFLHRAQRILESTEMAVGEARRAARGELGRITLGTMSSAMLPAFPPILRRFRASWSDVEVTFVQLHSNEQLQAVSEGRIDLGFVDISARDGQTDVNGVTVCVEPVWRETLVAALPNEHPLAGRASLSLAELAGDPFIMMPRQPATGLYDRIIRYCQEAGFSPVIRQEAAQLPIVVTLVAAGVGVALVPGCVAEPWRGALAFVPVRDTVHVDVAMIHRADNASLTLMAFKTAVQAEIASQPTDSLIAPSPIFQCSSEVAAE